MTGVAMQAVVPLMLPVAAVRGGEREQAVDVAAVRADRNSFPVVSVEERTPAEPPARRRDPPVDAMRFVRSGIDSDQVRRRRVEYEA